MNQETQNNQSPMFALLPIWYIKNYDEHYAAMKNRSEHWIVSLFEKLYTWEYENEWRITYGHHENNFIDLAPQKIYLGWKMSNEYNNLC